MAEIVESIDISRRPGAVFAYAADFSHFPEWQRGVVSVRRELARTEEITELNPPRTWTVHGGGGPLIAIAKVTIEPLDAARLAHGSRGASGPRGLRDSGPAHDAFSPSRSGEGRLATTRPRSPFDGRNSIASRAAAAATPAATSSALPMPSMKALLAAATT